MPEAAPQGPPPGPRKGRPDPEVAKTILLVGRELDVSEKVQLAAFEAALVESGMENLNYGDRDSVGVFQQRPSQNWGSAVQCMNVNYAAHKFFEKAVPIDRQEPMLTAGQLAQRVQVSAYPDRYDQREAAAQKLLKETEDALRTPPGPPQPPGPGPQPPTQPPPPAHVLREVAQAIGDIARRFDVAGRSALPATVNAAVSLANPTAFKLDEELTRTQDIWDSDVTAHVEECKRIEQSLLALAEGR